MIDAEDVEVVAWDGEGVGHPDHRYVLLGNSDGMELRRLTGLHTEEVLDFVWRTSAGRGALNVTYGASYDFNNWMRDLDFASAKRLHRGHPVTVGGLTVRYNGTWFELSKQGKHKVTIWDIWKFWGTRFDIALKEMFPDFHGLSVIEGMKERRGEFSLEMVEEMSSYNQLELEAMVMMTKQLFVDLAEAEIQRPSFLTGSGALAGSLLKQHGVAAHNSDVPREGGVYDAVTRAFSAGRIECLKVGTYYGYRDEEVRSDEFESGFHVYDLRSAYPRAMLDLPSMAAGSWVWHTDVSGEWDDRLSVWLCQWAWDREDVGSLPSRGRFFPFAVRDRFGGVKYPNWGRGWYWWPEVSVARELGFSFQVIGGWVWEPSESCAGALPFEWVERLYYRRLALKESGRTGAQRELKFALNSLYGKLCQARGSISTRPPANHNLAWAGWVTSHCRATLLEMMCRDPYSLVYVMTDSVASTAELDLDVGLGLGQWEHAVYSKAQVVQAGVVTLWNMDGVCETEKYRGFDVGSLRASDVDARWRENASSGVASKLAVPTVRPVNLGTALTSETWFEQWCTWVESVRELDVYGGGIKRWRSWDLREKEPWNYLCALSAWEPLPAAEALSIFDGVLPLSEPYIPKWADVLSRTLETVPGGVRERDTEDELEAALLRVRRL